VKIPDIAIITGAGWTPYNEGCTKDPDIVPRRTPELLWPLGDGHTVLSRLAAQFRSIGIGYIIAGVGETRSSPRAVEDRQQKIWDYDHLINYGGPVWTQARLNYVTSIGVNAYLMEDPHATGKTCWTTLATILVGLPTQKKWERIVVCNGDFIFKTACLHRLIEEATYPSQVWLWPKHSVDFLDRRGAETFLKYLDMLGTHHQGKVYLQRNWLTRYGLAMLDLPSPPKSQPKARRAAWRELSKHWFEVGVHVKRMQDFVAADPIKE